MTYPLGDGKLTISGLAYLFRQEGRVILSMEVKEQINAAFHYLQRLLQTEKLPVYGVNTGFGALCNTVIADDKLAELQYNLIRSHACGVGEEVPHEIVRLMLLLKAQSLGYGRSGVQEATVQRLIDMFNANVTPVVFKIGSLGASGDLAPLAHLSLPLIGEGFVYDGGQKVAARALEVRRGWRPLELGPKEGLALLNGTQFMSAYGVWLSWQARRLSDWSLIVSALSLEAFGCKLEPFHPLLQGIRPHRGQRDVAAAILKLLNDSPNLHNPKSQVQDPYSFRCIPQVHGAVLDTLRYAETVIETEINGVSDNPNIFPEADVILSGGNFHGQAIAQILDFMAIALCQLGGISERRVYQLLSGARGLPPFLAADPGLHSGFMILQYTAAGVVNKMKHLAAPHSLDSIPSSNGQEDYVSMGANAAVKCAEVADCLQTLLAIELLNASQALHLNKANISPALKKVLEDFRRVSPPADRDRIFSDDLALARQFLSQYALPVDLWPENQS